MQYSTAQYSSVQFSTVGYSWYTVQSSWTTVPLQHSASQGWSGHHWLVVPHWPVLYCTGLYSTVLVCTVQYCAVQCRTGLALPARLTDWPALVCTALACTTLYCTALYCTTLYFPALACTALA